MNRNFKLSIALVLATAVTVGCRKKSNDEEAVGNIDSVSGGGGVVSVSNNDGVSGAPSIVVGRDGKQSFAASNSIPGNFNILGPAASSSRNPEIKWAESTLARSYTVTVAEDKLCKEVIVTSGKLNALVWTVSQRLADSTYYVCVSSENTYGKRFVDNNGYKLIVNSVTPIVAFTEVADFINAADADVFTITGSCTLEPKVQLRISNSSNPIIEQTLDCVNEYFNATLDLSGLADGNTLFTISMAFSEIVSKEILKDTLVPTGTLNPVVRAVPGNVGVYPVSGTCVGGSVANVLVSGNSQFVSKSLPCSAGVWSSSAFDLNNLPEGTITVSAQICDAAQNCLNIASQNTVKDTVLPTLSIDAPTLNSSNLTAYGVEGECDEEGATVTWQISDSEPTVGIDFQGTSTCTSNAWNIPDFDATPLAQGPFTVEAFLTDASGNESITFSETAVKNTVAVSLNLATPNNVLKATQNSYGISGTCGNGANSETINWSIDDENAGTPAVSGNLICNDGPGTWAVAAIDLSSLDDGDLLISVDIAQAANPPPVETATVEKNVSVPAVPNTFVLSSPSTGLGNDTTPTLRWNDVVNDNIIRVWTNINCATQIAVATVVGNTLNISPELTEGDKTYEFWATSENSFGNRSNCSATNVSYILDTDIEEISAVQIAPSSSSPSKDQTPDIRVLGVASGYTVKLYSSASCFASDVLGFDIASGASIDITVEPGKITQERIHKIYARSNDPAGNYSSCSGVFASYILDQTPPSPPLTVALNTATPNTDTTPSFTVTGLGAGQDVRLYNGAGCSDLIGLSTATGNSLTFDTGALSVDGAYIVYATQTDAAGNESACSSANATYNLDVNPPSLSLVHIEGGGGGVVTGVNGKAYLTYTASEPLNQNDVTINGKVASVTNISGNTYLATYKFISGDVSSDPVAFSITYTDAVGRVSVDGPRTSTTDSSSLEFNAALYTPELVIGAQSGAENVGYSHNINEVNTGNDTDPDNDVLSYFCFYDQNIDGVVAQTTACTTLPGISAFTFNASSGQMNWTPNFDAAGDYEMRIVADDGLVKGEDIFILNVANTNRPPVLESLADKTLELGDTLQFNISDANTGNDTDIDGDPIIYSCVFDTTIDGAVLSGSDCTTLDGISFNASSGFFSWTVGPNTPGDFEFRIRGNDSDLDGDEYFNAIVNIDISRVPQLAMVGNNTVSYLASLSDNNEVRLNDILRGTYSAGDTFNLTTSKGDRLECTGGCYAISPIQGTAVWSTETYAGTLLSTYMGRYRYAKIVIAAFSQRANISIMQGGGELSSGVIEAEAIQEFVVDHAVGALWIQSDVPVSAYVSTSDNASYDRDGRVITASSTENLAFVSGAGGTPSAISTTTDNTYVIAYRNDGTDFDFPNNFMSATININEILTVTSSASQNGPLAAIAFYSDFPTVSTQHADSDGTNATPSLPKSMLSTHFVIPMKGDYVSLASFQNSTVTVIDENGAFVSKTAMTRAASADAKAPWAFQYDPGDSASDDIPEGYRFVCSNPCLGIFEPRETAADDDETLMVGTQMLPLGLASTDFTDAGVLPGNFTGNRASECTGTNDFPNLTWSSVPWGTAKFAIIVEDETANHVHLNLVDIDKSLDSLGTIAASSNVVTFPSGIEGNNGYASSGWEGPCQTTGTHTYRFKVYALSAPIGFAVNNMSIANFESTYSNIILGSSSLTGTYSE